MKEDVAPSSVTDVKNIADIEHIEDYTNADIEITTDVVTETVELLQATAAANLDSETAELVQATATETGVTTETADLLQADIATNSETAELENISKVEEVEKIEEAVEEKSFLSFATSDDVPAGQGVAETEKMKGDLNVADGIDESEATSIFRKAFDTTEDMKNEIASAISAQKNKKDRDDTSLNLQGNDEYSLHDEEGKVFMRKISGGCPDKGLKNIKRMIILFLSVFLLLVLYIVWTAFIDIDDVTINQGQLTHSQQTQLIYFPSVMVSGGFLYDNKGKENGFYN